MLHTVPATPCILHNMSRWHKQMKILTAFFCLFCFVLHAVVPITAATEDVSYTSDFNTLLNTRTVSQAEIDTDGVKR